MAKVVYWSQTGNTQTMAEAVAKGITAAGGSAECVADVFLELTSGLRKGELLALLWGDLDIEKHSISVTKSVSRRDGVLEVSPPKTRHSIRNIIIRSRQWIC